MKKLLLLLGCLISSDLRAAGFEHGTSTIQATGALLMGSYGINTSSNITANAYQVGGVDVLHTRYGTEDSNISIGKYAGASGNGGAQKNTFVGFYSGYGNSGYRNTCVGIHSCYASGASSYNTGIGEYSLFYANASALFNTCIGSLSCRGITSGQFNTFLGAGAGQGTDVTGSHNIAVGYQAGAGAITGGKNTLIGTEAGFAVNSGTDNTLIGYRSGYTITTGTGNIIIGAYQNTPDITTNYYLNIGGVIKGDVLTSSVTVAGAFSISGSSAPAAGFGLCRTTVGEIGHCTSVLAADGSCTCVFP